MTQYAYDPFGNVTIAGEIPDNPFQYTGRENDGTGLYYYRARYYSPELQRFISEDPILKPGNPKVPFMVPYLLTDPLAFNAYNYTGNNPVNRTDPTGEMWWIDLIDWAEHLIFPPKSCKDPGECTYSGQLDTGAFKYCMYDCADGNHRMMQMLNKNTPCPSSWNFLMNPSFYK